MDNTRLTSLIERAIANALTPQEHDELLALLAESRNKRQAEALLAAAWSGFMPNQPVFRPEEGRKMLQQILEKPIVKETVRMEKGHRFSIWRGVSVAASILLVTLAIYLAFYETADRSKTLTLTQAVEEAGIKPGRERAMITLGDGRTIVLDDIGHGMLVEEPGVHINKAADGQITYKLSPQAEATPITYHTITIPRGGQYRLILPDGTQVHLNSESTLTYPTRFDDTIRVVRLTGEAFFEVAKQGVRPHGRPLPFVVHTAAQEVKVLGTAFNMQTFNGTIRTALVEGSVRVTSNGGQTVLLKPGEAAIQPLGETMITVEKFNLDRELAWHHGYFIFHDEDIRHIMQRIARWYDVEVSYQGDMSNKRFGGIFQRSKSIAQLLENFRTTGLVDFKIAERRIVVMGK